jgi:hypothetical protein
MATVVGGGRGVAGDALERWIAAAAGACGGKLRGVDLVAQAAANWSR